ncbi:MAG: hypothetical protein KC431_05760, partial [Myxococcales bacterium]|nr:hypothetical protein [Myxococcales bacterium]
CGEAGLHIGWETAATVALRRAASRDRLARLCGAELEVAPCFMTYDPAAWYVEFVDAELVLTCLDPERAMPLIRYCLHDRGGLVDHERARALLAPTHPELADALPEPLIWLMGRSGEPWTPVFAEALAGLRDELALLTGAFFFDPEASKLTIQLAVDRIAPSRKARIEQALRDGLGGGGPADIEPCPRSAYPHQTNPWTRKFRRGPR